MILIDGNNLAFAAFATNRQLATSDGVKAGGLFGFLWTLRTMLSRCPGEKQIVVAWDAQPSWRVNVLGTYKENRQNKTPEQNAFGVEFSEQRRMIRNYIMHLGVSQVHAKGFEADDIAGDFVRRHSKGFPLPGADNGTLVLASNDKDWLQLITQDVKIWVPSRKGFTDFDSFASITGCTDSEEFVSVKAIMGDAGDDVPGVAGVGDKTALKFLRGELSRTTQKFNDISEWMENPEGYARSRTLVELRTAFIADEDYDLTCSAPDFGAFREICEKFQFGSILKGFDSWTAPFRQ